MPLPLNIGNARLHWRAKHREKQRYYDHLTMLMNARILPRPPQLWPKFARVEMVLYVWARLDRDNLYARVKWPCDWLAAHGYIAGDREDQIDLQVTQKVDRKHQRISVTIVPVDCSLEAKK